MEANNMDILSITIIVLSVLFISIKSIIFVCLEVGKRRDKKVSISIKTLDTIDEKFYSTLVFDFPNVQSEEELKILNSGPDLDKEQFELEVEHYCNF